MIPVWIDPETHRSFRPSKIRFGKNMQGPGEKISHPLMALRRALILQLIGIPAYLLDFSDGITFAHLSGRLILVRTEN